MKGFLIRGCLESWGWRQWGRRLAGACALSVLLAGCAPEWLNDCGPSPAPDPVCELDVEEPVPDDEPPDETPLGELPPGTLTCALNVTDNPPLGICVEYLDNGWHMGLFRMAYLPKEQLDCPASAPNAGLRGEEVTLDGSTPLQVIGCSINPFASCGSPGLACVPFEIDYPACISQDGPQRCPIEYPEWTTIEKDGPGGEATVCCARPRRPG
jgi:hypothetical protein